MSLQIWLGDASSGKSTRLLEEIIQHAEAHPDMSHLLLVPEQFCLSAQKKLVALHPRHALWNIEALSFDRLASRAFRELSAESTDLLSDTAKEMFLSLAVRQCRGKLEFYEKQTYYPSFVRRLSSLIAEWTMNDISPERLLELAGEESLPRLLRLKLKDFSLLYGAFREQLGKRQTAEEVLPRFSRLLPKSSVGRADLLYLDGFTGFTSVQYKILEELMRRTPQTLVVLTLPKEVDPAGSGRGEEDLFALSLKTISRLEGTAREAGQICSLHRFPGDIPKRDAFKRLEKQLFRGTLSGTGPADASALSLTACPDPEEEAALAARLIEKLVREDHMRFRDIAITVSDQNLYLPLLRRTLTESAVPFFSDRREPLAAHPLIRLLSDALEALGEGFPREMLLRLVKNPAAPFLREERDRFENYLLACGIRRGKHFQEAFSRRRKRRRGETQALGEEEAEREREEMELLRGRLMTPLLRLKEGLGIRTSARNGAQALRLFLEDWGLNEEKLKALEEDRKLLLADGISWQEVMAQVEDFLSHMEQIMGDIKLGRGEFSDMVRSALESLNAGRLPMSPDQVVIGDVERSRLGDIKALIFLGMNEDKLPGKGSKQRLLTDHERLALSFFEEDLGYTDSRALSEERFYLYCLLQKPRERLFLSYSLKDAQPSFVVEEIRSLFPNLPLVRMNASESKEGGSPEDFPRIQLSEKALNQLYGPVLNTSISGLESFALCPYAFFMGRGLGLEPRQELSWGAADHGSFFHKVAELLMTRIREEGQALLESSSREKRQLVQDCLEGAVKQVGLLGLEEGAQTRYSLHRWGRFFEIYLEYLIRQGLKDGFVPSEFERSFGPGEKDITRISLKKGRDLQLRGVIDRLDIKEGDGEVFLRVVDYKTRKSTEFVPGKLVEGQSLQLAVYLDIALKLYEKKFPGRSLRPGGICYGSLAEQLIEWRALPEERQKLLWDSMSLKGLMAQEVSALEYNKKGELKKKSGVVSARRLELTADYAREKVRSLGEEIYGGDVTPAPWKNNGSDSCSYCDFKDACPFDEARNDCRFRTDIPAAAQAWEIIAGQEKGEGDSEQDREQE